MQVLIIPDSFKGTLSAEEAAKAMAEGVEQILPQAQCLLMPMADGGEGSSKIASSLFDAKRIEKKVIGPEGVELNAFYYRSKYVAFIELAAASGFALSKSPKDTAFRASTYGTGQLIEDAVLTGATEIRLFLGGSATTDAGVGFAKALGAAFYDSTGDKLPDANTAQAHDDGQFIGEQINKIASIDLSAVRELLGECKITAAADVNNPLCGPTGAAHTYGPQKSLSKEQVLARDSEISRLAKIVASSLGTDFSLHSGAGAAGGAGFGVLAFLGGRLLPGAEFFLDAIDFDSKISSCEIVLTGEGRADLQSVQGKLIGEIAERTKDKKIEVYCLCGQLALGDKIPEMLKHIHFAQIESADAMTQPFVCLKELTAQTIARDFAK